MVPGLVIAEDRSIGPIVEKARKDLAARLRRDHTNIPEPTIRSSQWPDSAMSIHPTPGERVIHKPTPGYVILFNVGGMYHIYHARQTDGVVRYDSHVGANY